MKEEFVNLTKHFKSGCGIAGDAVAQLVDALVRLHLPSEGHRFEHDEPIDFVSFLFNSYNNNHKPIILMI